VEQQPPNRRHALAQALDEEARLQDQFLQKSGGRERLSTLREEMQATMEKGAGIYRGGDELAFTTAKLLELQERSRCIALDDHSHAFNTELVSALELSFMLDVAESMTHSALYRTESRGAHQRTDFPARNDEKFLAHSLVYRQADGRPGVQYSPVTITRWPPGERVYGR
jgi:fumarate reductase flavoprotein subunit